MMHWALNQGFIASWRRKYLWQTMCCVSRKEIVWKGKVLVEGLVLEGSNWAGSSQYSSQPWVISISKALPIECRSPVTENFIWQLMKMGEQIDEVIFYQSLCARWNERLSSMGHCFWKRRDDTGQLAMRRLFLQCGWSDQSCKGVNLFLLNLFLNLFLNEIIIIILY